MSDGETIDGTQEQDAQRNLGAILRKGREEKGLSQTEVAEQLCLRPRSIEALESDTIEEGVSPTYVKGYVRLYAKLLALKPEPLLLAFDKLHEPANKQTSLQSFSRRVAREANDSRWNIVTYIIAFLVIGSVVLWWFEQSDFSSSSENAANAALENAQLESAQEAQRVAESNTQNDGGSSLANTGVLDDENPQSQDEIDAQLDALLSEQSPSNDLTSINSSPGTNSTPLEDANNFDELDQALSSQLEQSQTPVLPEVLSGIVASEEPLQSDSPHNMVFTFSDDCWVSVKDAFGETIAIGTKVKGRVMSVSGIPPISVVLGAPQVVQIDVNGTPIDMSIYPEGSTASFQIPK